MHHAIDPAPNSAVLHLLCGRIAAGKSTLAKALAKRHNAILIGEDDCLGQLYLDSIQTLDDYLHYSQRFKHFIAPYCVDLLRRGINVVLDFPANTPALRQWLKRICDQAEARHLLHYVTTPTERCKQQLQQRIAAQGKNASPIAVENFDTINRHFVPPSVTEGFNLEINR